MTTNPHEPPNYRDCWWSLNLLAAQQVGSFWQLSYDRRWYSHAWQARVEPHGCSPESLARWPKFAANDSRLNWLDVANDIAAVEQAIVDIAGTVAEPAVAGVLADSAAIKPGQHLLQVTQSPPLDYPRLFD